MSFRLKITTVVLSLTALIMVAVLWFSLGFLGNKLRLEIQESNANAIHQIKQFSVMEAIVVEDYGKLIVDFRIMVEQLNLDAIVLYNIENKVLASSKLDQVGEKIDPEKFNEYWNIESISSGSGATMFLAYCFNNDAVEKAKQEALGFGLLLITFGVLLMSGIGYLAGAWLSGRLEKMVDSLDIITSGHIEKFEVDSSRDEIGLLSRFVHQIGKKIALQKEELLDSEERMRLALQSAGAGAWKYDVKKSSLFWTAKNYQIFGLLPSDKEPSIELWFSYVHPEDQDLVAEELRQLFEERKNLCVEYRILRRSGETRWVRSVGRLFVDENDKPVEAYGMLFDISHHKSDYSLLESQKKLWEAVADHNAELSIVINAKKEIVAANRKAQKLFSIPKLDKPIDIRSVFSQQIVDQIISAMMSPVTMKKITVDSKSSKDFSHHFLFSTSSYQDDDFSEHTIVSFYPID